MEPLLRMSADGVLERREETRGESQSPLRSGEVDPALLEKVLLDLMDGVTPRAIREHLGLNKPIYARTAAYGHFGRQPDNEGGFSWEKTDLVPELKKLV